MKNFDYNIWLKRKINELINTNVKYNEKYNEEVIREYLIFATYTDVGGELLNFFKKNTYDEDLLKMLLRILLDESEEYSNDARYSAARIIPLFDSSILKKYKKELSYAQNYSIINLRPFSKGEPDWLYQ